MLASWLFVFKLATSHQPLFVYFPKDLRYINRVEFLLIGRDVMRDLVGGIILTL